MDGSEKIPLLVIGKSLNPRCFGKKNNRAKLPVNYKANKKAWMTGKTLKFCAKFFFRRDF
jgi:hypothetical protein